MEVEQHKSFAVILGYNIAMAKTNLDKEAVEDIVTKRIRPFFELDHGSMEIVEVSGEQGRVIVRFSGVYRGSPCRETLAKYVVEPVLKKEFQSIRAVEWVD